MVNYLQAVNVLNDYDLDLLELNISCPNVKAGGMNFGVKTEMARRGGTPDPESMPSQTCDQAFTECRRYCSTGQSL